MRSKLHRWRWIIALEALGCSSAHEAPEAEHVGDPASAQRPDAPAATPEMGDQHEPPGTAAQTPAPEPSVSRDPPASAPTQPSPGSTPGSVADPAPANDRPPASGPSPGRDVRPADDVTCLGSITRYQERGPFAFAREREQAVKLWVPALPAGCKAPVMHFALGTGATCDNYLPLLEHLASHGFLAVCYDSPAAGRIQHCMDALETAYRLHPELAAGRIGLAGHHTGGADAISCLARAEQHWGDTKRYAVHATLPASGTGATDGEPWHESFAKVRSPLLLLSSSEDALVSSSWVGKSFDALSDAAEAYWYEAPGLRTIPVPLDFMRESSVVFLRWKLLDDLHACARFKALPAAPGAGEWTRKQQQNPRDCGP